MKWFYLPCSLIFSLLLFSCSKTGNTVSPIKKDTTSSTTSNAGTTTNTGNTGTTTNTGNTGTTTSTTTTCNATVADAENIEIFPADNSWNQDISGAPVDPYSSQIIATFSTAPLKAEFGSGLWNNVPMGDPFIVVCGSQPKVKVTFRANSYDANYGNLSFPGPYPIPANAPIENNGQDDAHVIVVDKDNGLLYELYNASVSNGQWSASSGGVFNLKSDSLGNGGADASGLPIFPGLVRYDEVLKGTIDHALRFTLAPAHVKPGFVAPARNSATSSTGGQYALPYGAKIRLKASFDISGYPADLQVILKAMKKYGLILADLGADMYVTGAPDPRWNNAELHQLGNIPASNFEVVKFE
ncbi:MAG TPA: hypothetical protein VG367_05810 [Mucilaginibacter sp.]|jgi:hypothetical protein|nr:hypothetical protein [Mucilaginibacter sp.]